MPNSNIINSPAFTPLAKKAESGKSIHELLDEAHQALRTLYWSITDSAQQQQISMQMEEINRLNFVLFKNKIKTNTAAWETAMTQIGTAKTATEEAQKDIEKVVKTLQLTAQAIKAVSDIVAMFA